MEYVEIGKIVNTFGIKGELKITSESDFIKYRFQKGKEVYFKMGNKYLKFKVSSLRIIKGNVCITVNEMYDINMINMYIGCSVYADKADKPTLQDGQYMIDDLVGMECYLEDNTLYGTINDVICLPASNVLEVIKTDKTVELIPFVKQYIISVTDNVVIKPLGELI